MKTKKRTSSLSLGRLLFEQDEDQTIPTDVSPQSTTQPQNYSLDQKVDHFFIQYERESNPEAAMFATDSGMGQAMTNHMGVSGTGAGFTGGQSNIGTPGSAQKGIQEKRNNKKSSLRTFLWEADDAPDAGADAGGLGGGDLGGGPSSDLGSPPGGDGGDAQPASDADVPKPQINLPVFANKLSRLINNFESLVNPKIIVLNRAYAYIRQNYDENTAKELLIILESNYDLSNMTLGDKEKSLVGQVPFAVGAGDGSGGAAGGGGGSA